VETLARMVGFTTQRVAATSTTTLPATLGNAGAVIGLEPVSGASAATAPWEHIAHWVYAPALPCAIASDALWTWGSSTTASTLSVEAGLIPHVAIGLEI